MKKGIREITKTFSFINDSVNFYLGSVIEDIMRFDVNSVSNPS